MNEIRTPEELGALPVGSVVRDARQRIAECKKGAEEERYLAYAGVGDALYPEELGARRFPLTVLYRPDAPTPPTEDREALAEMLAQVLPGAAVWYPDGDDEDGPSGHYLVDWSATAERVADATLAARQPAPVDAAHTVTAEWDDGWSGTTFTFHCHAGSEAMCHAVYDCGCEEWARDEVEDGRPWHEAYDHKTDAEVRHYGTFNPDMCGLRDWFENTDDPMRGELTFAVDAEHQGDYYLFRPAQEVSRG